MADDKELMARPHPEGEGGGEDGAAESAQRPSSAAEGGAAAAGPGVAAPAAPADLTAAYEKLLVEKNELFDRLLRKQAEFENFRKRVQREKEDFIQHSTADLIRALLPTLDGFERALKKRDPGVPETFYQGMELIYRELLEVLKRAGLVAIQTQGQLFDPHLHQAVESVECGDRRDQEIVEELQRGYKLRQRLLRPAIVKVAVTPRGQSPTPAPGKSAKGD